MQLSAKETWFLTALCREQNQSGCRGPAHDLLRRHAYPEVPTTGPGSLAFTYETVPLTSLLLRQFTDLQQIDDFLRHQKLIADPEWPWSSLGEDVAASPVRLLRYATRSMVSCTVTRSL